MQLRAMDSASEREQSFDTSVSGYVSFLGDVSSVSVGQLFQALAGLLNSGATEVHLQIASKGGDIGEGLTAFRLLRELPLRLMTYNMSKIESIANILFLAGDERFADQNARFNFHGVSAITQLPTSMSADRLRWTADQMDMDLEQVVSVVADRSKLSRDCSENLFSGTFSLDAAQAERYGLIDSVRAWVPGVASVLPVCVIY